MYSLLSPFLRTGIITPVCPCFSAIPEHQATWHTRVSQTTPWFKGLSISGRISSQPTAFPALNVLKTRKALVAMMVFLPPNVIRVSPMVWQWLTLKDLWNTLSIYQRVWFSLLSKTPFWSLMDLAVWDLLPQRRLMACQNTLLACQ